MQGDYRAPDAGGKHHERTHRSQPWDNRSFVERFEPPPHKHQAALTAGTPTSTLPLAGGWRYTLNGSREHPVQFVQTGVTPFFLRSPIMAKKVVKKPAASKAKPAAKIAKKSVGAGMIGRTVIG